MVVGSGAGFFVIGTIGPLEKLLWQERPSLHLVAFWRDMVNSAYSSFQHLADALFFNQNARHIHFAIMNGYTSYSDAGGDKHCRIMTVAGFISNAEDWKLFDREWAKVLGWAKLPYVHMNRFVAHKYHFQNKKWERKELRDEFIVRLIDAIGKHVDFLALNVLSIHDWKTINAEYRMKESGLTPFVILGCAYVAVVEKWCRVKGVPWSQMEIVFEAGDEGKGGNFQAWCKKIFHKTPIPKPGIQEDDKEPDEYPLNPLQACDFVAWETRRAETAVQDDPPHYILRKSLEEILERIPQYEDHQS